MPAFFTASYTAWPTVASALPWWHYFQHATDPSIGYEVTFAPFVNVHCISDIKEGVARPAWYPARLADVEHANVDLSTGGTPEQGYYAITDGTDYVQWTVPADGDGCDTLLVGVVGVASAAILDIVKNPAGAATVVGTVATANGTTSYTLVRTVNLAVPLVAGDVLRFRRTSGETTTGRVRSFMAYDSDGTVSAHGRAFALPSSTKIDGTGDSSVELAYCIAPDGSTPKWIGGSAHQTIDIYATEVSPVVTYSRNGTVGALTPGWVTGDIVMRRVADADYNDVPHTIMGSLVTEYALDGTSYGVNNQFTAGIALDTGGLYPCMCEPNTGFKWAFIRSGSRWIAYATTATDDSESEVAAGYLAPVNRVYFGPTPLKAVWKTSVLSHTHAWSRCHLWHRAVGSKFYAKFLPAGSANEPAGAVWGGSWKSEFVSIMNRREQPRYMLIP
jgi:hypothetical protein